jgi:hypothetical protein
MKFIGIILLLSILLTGGISAQEDSVVVTPELLSKFREQVVERYDTARKSPYIIYFPMRYGKFIFTEADKQLFKTLEDTIVERIDLVYTVYRRDKSFDQKKLNKERYEMLQQYFPEAFDNNLIDWNLIAQDGFMEYKTAQTLFHGFVIYLKPHGVVSKTGELIQSALDLSLDEPETHVLEPTEAEKTIRTFLDASVATKTVYDTTYVKRPKRYWTGKYLAKTARKRKKGKRYDKAGRGKRKRPKEYKTKYLKEIKVTSREVPDLSAGLEPEKAIAKLSKDSVVYTSFKRVVPKDNKKYVLVQDVTGSMHPYLAQTLLYMHTHMLGGEKHFVFFNDGDGSPDGPIGRTGGTYYVKTDKVSEVEKIAFEAMRKGKGGKQPENDIEAILYGIKQSRGCDEIILVADNYARVRDMRLLKRLVPLNIPVRVVVCGVAKGEVVNLDYIYLARLTNGSLHTMNQDIVDLGAKKDGDSFKIGTQYFRIEGAKIRLIHQSKPRD